MGLYANIYRVGSNYKLNLRPTDENYEEQFRDDFGTAVTYESRFNQYEELDMEIKRICGAKGSEFEFELTKAIVEDLMVFAIKSNNPQSQNLILTCKDAFKALRQGYRIVYYSER